MGVTWSERGRYLYVKTGSLTVFFRDGLPSLPPQVRTFFSSWSRPLLFRRSYGRTTHNPRVPPTCLAHTAGVRGDGGVGRVPPRYSEDDPYEGRVVRDGRQCEGWVVGGKRGRTSRRWPGQGWVVSGGRDHSRSGSGRYPFSEPLPGLHPHRPL